MKKEFVSSRFNIKKWDLDKICEKSDIIVKKGNTYLVKGNIIIGKDHILNLNGNIKTIKFYKDLAIVVEGKLITNTNKEKILLTSYNNNKTKKGTEWPNEWKGLIIKGEAKIKDLLIMNSVAGIYIINGKAEISDCQLTSNLYGIRCDKSKILINKNEFKYCSDGIYLYHCRVAQIQNNRFLNNGCGVYCFFSDGTISNNNIEVFEKEFMKGIFSGIYSYGSKLKIIGNIIKTTPLGLVCGMDSSLTIKNNSIETPRTLHVFNPYIQFDVHLESDINIYSCNKRMIRLYNKELELPSYLGKNKKFRKNKKFKFYRNLIEKIPKYELKDIIKELTKKVNKEDNDIYKNNLYKKITTKIYKRFKKLKQACFLYSSSKDKKYLVIIKKIIEDSENYFEDYMWMTQPGLDIPSSYYLQSYCLCHNLLKKDRYLKKEFKQEIKKIKNRCNELSKHNEWWINQIEGLGLNTHQELLALSSLLLFALEFNLSEKFFIWKEIFEKSLKKSIKNKKYYLKTETPVFIFELYFYLKENNIKDEITDEFIKKSFKKDIINKYIEKSIMD
jgi:hypothetical protein